MIPIEYTLLLLVCVAAAWMLVKSEGSKILRGVMIVALVVSSLYVFHLLEKYRGTPKVSSLPPDVVVFGAAVDEDSGRIYLFCSHDGGIPPSSLQVPYSKEVHEALEAGKAAFGGKPFRMQSEGAKGGDGEGGGPAGVEGNERAEGGGSLSQESSPTVKISIPESKLPSKGLSQ